MLGFMSDCFTAGKPTKKESSKHQGHREGNPKGLGFGGIP